MMKNHKCDECDESLFHRYQLKEHKEAVHEGLLFSCSECEYKTKYKRWLPRHVKSEHKKIRYECNICGHRARRKSNIRIHIGRNHSGGNSFINEVVLLDEDVIKRNSSEPFPSNDDSLNHFSSEILTKVCPYCESKINSGNLKRHIDKIHLGVKYSCLVCKYTVKSKYKVKGHIKKSHPEVEEANLSIQRIKLESSYSTQEPLKLAV